MPELTKTFQAGQHAPPGFPAELSRQKSISYEIKKKTDKFCVHTPDENNLQIFPEGLCP
jgi:hypothetical protein